MPPFPYIKNDFHSISNNDPIKPSCDDHPRVWKGHLQWGKYWGLCDEYFLYSLNPLGLHDLNFSR